MAAHYQTGVDMSVSCKNKLLVAHPNLKGNDLFEKAVIYIYEHNFQGASGIILNKSSDVSVQLILDQKGLSYYGSDPVYRGGPVNVRSLCMLHSNEWFSSNTMQIGKYSLTSDNFMLEKVSMDNHPVHWKMFTGMCGWAPGQLEAEIEGKTEYGKDKGWLVIDPSDNIMFEHDGDEQWVRAISFATTQAVSQYLTN